VVTLRSGAGIRLQAVKTLVGAIAGVLVLVLTAGMPARAVAPTAPASTYSGTITYHRSFSFSDQGCAPDGGPIYVRVTERWRIHFHHVPANGRVRRAVIKGSIVLADHCRGGYERRAVSGRGATGIVLRAIKSGPHAGRVSVSTSPRTAKDGLHGTYTSGTSHQSGLTYATTLAPTVGAHRPLAAKANGKTRLRVGVNWGLTAERKHKVQLMIRMHRP
jgi:hypothetical protein